MRFPTALITATLIVGLGLVTSLPAQARDGLRLEILGGAPLNLATDFELSLDGAGELEFRGSYSSRPFEIPVYYAIRLSLRGESSSWALELMHHKVYLDDPPPDIDSFSVTHGFNMVSAQRSWRFRSVEPRVLIGFVLAHPESRVRGEWFDEKQGILGSGYRIAGPALGVGLGETIRLRGRVSAIVEGRATWAPVSVPVSGGEAEFTSAVLHAMAGIAVAF